MREKEIDRERERLTSKTERNRQSQIVRETKRDTHKEEAAERENEKRCEDNKKCVEGSQL